MNQIDHAALRAAIEDASTPLVVDINADWCRYCKTTLPHLQRLSEERAGSIRFVGIDADDNEEAHAYPGYETLPAIILYKDGQEVARRGSGDYEQLTAWLAEHGL